MISGRIGILASILAIVTACTTESAAVEHIARDGCTNVAVERTGMQTFDWTATCDGRFCEGDVELFGGSSQGSQMCSLRPPERVGHVQGPGIAVLGEGNASGLCSVPAIEAQLVALRPRIEACYDLALQSDPELAGTATWQWQIGEDGAATLPPEDFGSALFACGKAAIGDVSWPPPERGVCTAMWTFGLHTGAPRSVLGHGRYPTSTRCDNPLTALLEAPNAVHPSELPKAQSGAWGLESVEVWSSSLGADKTAMHVLADHFPPAADPLQHTWEGPVDSRRTLLCHTMPLEMEKTSETLSNGETVQYSVIGSDQAATSNSNARFPAYFSLDDNRAYGLRRFETELLNGKLVSEVTDFPLEDGAVFTEMFEGLESSDSTVVLKATPLQADALALTLHIENPNFAMTATGTYRRR